MKTLTLLALTLCCSMFALAQTIKIDNGAAIYHAQSKDLNLFSGNITGYSGLVGLEYLEHKHFYLSSELGYLPQGGRGNSHGEPDLTEKESWGYLHANTTFRGKIVVSKTELFAGVGPYVNLLPGSDRMKADFWNQYDYHATRVNWGGRMEAGFNEFAGRYKIGVYASYLVGLSGTIKTVAADWDSRTLAVYLSVGYRLK